MTTPDLAAPVSVDSPLWRLLASAAATRVVELSRRPRSEGAGGSDRRLRLAAVTAAYHADRGRPLVFGWHRGGRRMPMQVITAGSAAGQPSGDGRVMMSVPPGAVGLAVGSLTALFAAVPCWARLIGIADNLLDEENEPFARDDLRPSLDECLLRIWHEAFAWLLIAEPLNGDTVANLAGAAAAEERDARARQSSPEHTIRAARLGRRHRELRQGESTGMWRVHLFAGGASPAAATAVAGLLCASADLDRTPYRIAPAPGVADLATMVAQGAQQSTFVASSMLVATLAAAPVDEVPGLRLVQRSEFDVTPETDRDPDAARSLVVGAVLDHNDIPVQGLRIPLSSLNRHTFVCGATGSGKSQTVRHLLEAASTAGLPWLVVEPAKAEYRQMADRIGGDQVLTVRLGDPGSIPAGFNPLQPAAGFALQTHADLLRSLFLAAFEADEPFPQVLSAALLRSYDELGWDLALGEPKVAGALPRYPTLADLQVAAERVVDEIGYGREVTDNVRGFIRVRLSSLRLGTTGRFFEGGHPLDIAAMMRRNVIFEIEDVGDDRDKAFLMGALLIQLVEHLRVEVRTHPELSRAGLRHLSVFEEAHRLLRRTDHPGPAAHAVELFGALLAEIRAYGEGIVIAEQIPSKLLPDVIKNTAVKVIHRLPALDDRQAVGATVNLSERQSEYVVTLPPGTGAVFTDGMDQPILVRMPDGTHRERGGRTPMASVAEIVGRRSGTCGAECLSQPCTLRDMRSSQHVLEGGPWLALWAEFAVVGHLTGWPVPALRAEHLRELWSLPDRVVQCGLSQAVDDAVAVRSAALQPGIGPTDLARHVLCSLEGQLVGEARCESAEVRYLARPYRWQRLWDDLRAVDTNGPHPGTAGWEEHYGRSIPGRTTAEQAAVVRSWLDADQSDAAACRHVVFGGRSPSTVEIALRSTFGKGDWPQRLTEVTTRHFAGVTWPVHQFAPRSEVTHG